MHLCFWFERVWARQAGQGDPRPGVWFSAVRAAGLRCRRDCVVTYSRLESSSGGDLQPGTGVFTAPAPGSYYFQALTPHCRLCCTAQARGRSSEW